MFKNRIEIVKGRVQSIRAISGDGETTTTEVGNLPPQFHFFVDAVSDNQRHKVWDCNDYHTAKKVACLTAKETGLEIVDLAGCCHAA